MAVFIKTTLSQHEIWVKFAVADPGFPVWGGGGTEPLRGCQPPTWVLFGKTCTKMKELDPIGGAHASSAHWIR